VAATWSDNSRPQPIFTYEQNGVRFRIQPVPRRRSRGATGPSRAIAGRMLAPLSIQPQEPIRNAVLGKAGRYGELDAPYIVALNAMSDYADADSTIDALFGSPAVMVRSTLDGFEERPGRTPDGAWMGRAGPVNRRERGALDRAPVAVEPWPTPGEANPESVGAPSARRCPVRD